MQGSARRPEKVATMMTVNLTFLAALAKDRQRELLRSARVSSKAVAEADR